MKSVAVALLLKKAVSVAGLAVVWRLHCLIIIMLGWQVVFVCGHREVNCMSDTLPPFKPPTKSMHIYMQDNNTPSNRSCRIPHVPLLQLLPFYCPKTKVKHKETVHPARLSLGTTIIHTQAVAGRKKTQDPLEV